MSRTQAQLHDDLATTLHLLDAKRNVAAITKREAIELEARALRLMRELKLKEYDFATNRRARLIQGAAWSIEPEVFINACNRRHLPVGVFVEAIKRSVDLKRARELLADAFERVATRRSKKTELRIVSVRSK